ncbi:MAG: phenylacetate--CoA ligase family protein [Archangium sp.]
MSSPMATWIPSLADPSVDRLSREERESFILGALRRQLSFMQEVGFWQRRLARHALTSLDSLDEFTRLPPLTKAEMRALSPWELVPGSSRSRLRACFGTSGTTGKPVSLFWTEEDWGALAETVSRLLKPHQPPTGIVALNGYHQGHLAARTYDAALQRLGALSIPRHYLADDEPSTFEQLSLYGCNTLILAQRSGLRKGGKSVEDLLAADGQFFRRLGLTWWIGSSSTFTPELRTLTSSQGVAVTNLYGSSEFGMLAVSCRAEPTHFHVALGHAFVEVVDDSGLPVRSGQRGRVVASKLCSVDGTGALGPHTGSQLLRLDNGDEATWMDEPCACGLTAPRIHSITRRREA